MDDGLAAIAVRIFFLDHGRRITRFVALLDDRAAITIAVTVMIVSFADRNTGADRPDADTNLIRKGRRSHHTNDGGNK
jgi:hypothetical protein